MTREEAISCAKQIRFRGYLRGANPFYEQDAEALEMAIKALSQEPTEKSMCDRNICISNEYNGIECDECVVNKAEQEPRTTTNNKEPMTMVYPTIFCDDAISRDAVDKYIARLLSGYLYDGERERLEIFSAYLWELPSVTQKSGKWIEQEGWDGDVYYECSMCGEAFCLIDGTPTDNMYNYCPNCGAKMESEE